MQNANPSNTGLLFDIPISCNTVLSNSTGLANWNWSKQQQYGPQLNSKLADVTYEWDQNVSVYTNATISWGWLILVRI